MIRVSIEVPEGFQYRLKPVVDLRSRFLDYGILVGFGLKGADLRIIHQDIAIAELANSPSRRLATPTIIDERVDGAQIIDRLDVRELMEHPDVKLWLKRNTFRDYKLNNTPLVAGRYHYHLLNEVPEFHVDAVGREVSKAITFDMAKKIRLLPTVSVDRFAYFREQKIDWNHRRPIDVMFAGLVDYEIRGTDFWDDKFDLVVNATNSGVEFLNDRHRRAAVQQLTRLRHLRVLIGMNRSIQHDLYGPTMLRSSISISPWGFGEYGYRDYESVLAGCVMVKPDTDYVQTFAPDIYQSEKYYIACKPDFSDLPEIVERIMRDRTEAIELARRARADMLEANTPDRVFDYYLGLFREALGEEVMRRAESQTDSSGPLVSLTKGTSIAVRASVRRNGSAAPAVGAESTIVLTEDKSPNNSHDLRIFSDQPAPVGLYRVRAVVRHLGRKGCALQLHQNWKDQIWVDVDLESGRSRMRHEVGRLFKFVYGVESTKLSDGWVAIGFAVHLTDVVDAQLGLVLYASDDPSSSGYDGDGRDALEVAALDVTRMDVRASGQT